MVLELRRTVSRRVIGMNVTRSNKNETSVKFDLSRPLLHRAAEHGQVEQVRLIGQSMANINLKDSDGLDTAALGCTEWSC